MALSEAILVCLADGPLTGYDLAKTFSQSIGFFWHADHQQIYRVLRRLEENGLVTDELVVQQGRPNKRVYSITSAGLHRLTQWSRETHEVASVKDDLLVKLYGLQHVDVASVRGQVAHRLEQHRRRLALYERIETEGYDRVDPRDPATTGRMLGLALGLAYERSWVEWCTLALDRLEGLGAPDGPAEAPAGPPGGASGVTDEAGFASFG
jgi:DNA-binding PadR family transcriptional regulator